MPVGLVFTGRVDRRKKNSPVVCLIGASMRYRTLRCPPYRMFAIVCILLKALMVAGHYLGFLIVYVSSKSVYIAEFVDRPASSSKSRRPRTHTHPGPPLFLQSTSWLRILASTPSGSAPPYLPQPPSAATHSHPDP